MLTLADVINRANARQLTLMTAKHSIPGQAMSQKEMAAALHKRLSDGAYIGRCVESLPEHAYGLLCGALMQSDFQASQPTERLVFGQPTLRDEMRAMGFLSDSGEMPIEVARAVAVRWARELTWPGKVQISGFCADPSGPAVVRDLVAVLGLAARRALPLTQNGTLFKKAEERLLKQAEDACQVKPGLLPLIMVDYAHVRGLVTETDYEFGGEKPKPGLVCTPKAAEWVKRSRAELWADIAENQISEGSLDFGGVRGALLVLAASTPGAWLSESAWMETVNKVARTPSWPPVDGQRLHNFLLILASIDLTEVVSVSGQFLIRVTPALRALAMGELPPLPPDEPTFVVQPTYDVVAPKTLPPAVQYELERLTEGRQADKVLQYKLSASGLRPALEAGEDLSGLLRFLADHSRTPLPPNVAAEVRGWVGRGVRASFVNATLLQVADAEAGAQVAADRQVKGLLLAQLSPTVFVVEGTAVEKVRRRLGDLGLTTMPGVAKYGRPAEPDLDLEETDHRNPAPIAARAFADRFLGGPFQGPGVETDSPAAQPLPSNAPRNLADCAAQLRTAAAARTVVRIGYENGGIVRTWTVSPHRVLDDRLFGYCEEAGEDRRFKLARIRSIELTDESF